MNGGLFGYGLGSAIRSYMDQKNQTAALELKRRQEDIAERESNAKLADQGYYTDSNEDPSVPVKGLISPPKPQTPKQGAIPYPADQTSQNVSQGLLKPDAVPPTAPGAAQAVKAQSVESGIQNKIQGLLKPEGVEAPQDEVGGLIPKMRSMAVESASQGGSPDAIPVNRMDSIPAPTQVPADASPDVAPRDPLAGVPTRVNGLNLSRSKRMNMRMKESEAQRSMDAYDANSEYSQHTVQALRSIYNQLPGPAGDDGNPVKRGDFLFPEGMSAAEAMSIAPHAEKVLSAYTAGLKNQAVLNRYKQTDDFRNQSLDLQRQGLEQRKNHDADTVSLSRQRLDATNERSDRMLLKLAIQRLSSDSINKQRLTQYQNLDNAMAILTKAKRILPETIQEFQTALRSNLGIKGTGGVDERKKTYLDELGFHTAEWQQFLTGNLANISPNHPMVQHMVDLANVERASIKHQYQSRVDALEGGTGALLARNPKLAQIFKNSVDKFSKQMDRDPVPAPKNQTQAPSLDDLTNKLKKMGLYND